MSNFVDSLIKKHSITYNTSITHPLTNEMCEGSLPDHKLFTYLTQDLKFFQVSLNLFGKVLALCDDATSSIVLGKQIGFISNDENDYFFNCLEELQTKSIAQLEQNVSKMFLERPTLPEVEEYIEFLTYLIHKSESYVELITFMYVLEKVYLGWANYHLEKGNMPSDLAYKYNEWVVLHSGTAFTNWVEFLKNEINRIVKSEEQRKLCEETFLRTLNLEISFFTTCYNYSEI